MDYCMHAWRCGPLYCPQLPDTSRLVPDYWRVHLWIIACMHGGVAPCTARSYLILHDSYLTIGGFTPAPSSSSNGRTPASKDPHVLTCMLILATWAATTKVSTGLLIAVITARIIEGYRSAVIGQMLKESVGVGL